MKPFIACVTLSFSVQIKITRQIFLEKRQLKTFNSIKSPLFVYISSIFSSYEEFKLS